MWWHRLRETWTRKSDPLSYATWQSAALIAVLAWAGVGADSLSSAAYGPEEAFKSLRGHRELIIWIAPLTAVTVMFIAAAYAQLIELFPTGGGGYQAATRLLHPLAGLASGSALLVDYALTIAISVAAAVDALISLMPGIVHAKPGLVLIFLGALTFINLRGVREAVTVLAPIFFAFLVTHGALIVTGLSVQAADLGRAFSDAVQETGGLASGGGWGQPLGLVAAAYAAGAGTYTGIEALSNNAHILRAPRARTGAHAMAMIAVSLALTAGGIILLYAIWAPEPQQGATLNAVVFGDVLSYLLPNHPGLSSIALSITMGSAALLLLVAANAGFLGGPSVLASMSLDGWAPRIFSHLSSRLVPPIGIVTMAGGALILLIATGSEVHRLVVLYSVNVFLTFSFSLGGLVRHRLRTRNETGGKRRLTVAVLAFVMALTILATLIFEKFTHGAWVALVAALILAACGHLISTHYQRVAEAFDRDFQRLIGSARARGFDEKRTATHGPHVAVMLGQHAATGLHAVLNATRLFRARPATVTIVTVGEVDAECFGGYEALKRLKRRVGDRAALLDAWCRDHGISSSVRAGFGSDPVAELERLCLELHFEAPDIIFVATRPIVQPASWLARLLHGHVALSLQRRLNAHGIPLIILPMTLTLGCPSQPNASTTVAAIENTRQ